MCFMTFVSLSSCRLLLLQRWDNKWTETEDCRLYVICRYYFRLSVQNADTSAMISSGSEHTGRHSQDPAIWCDVLLHNNTTLQHGAGGMCLQAAVSTAAALHATGGVSSGAPAAAPGCRGAGCRGEQKYFYSEFPWRYWLTHPIKSREAQRPSWWWAYFSIFVWTILHCS